VKKHVTKATIFAVDQLSDKYPVCCLEQIYYEDDTFEYIFKPNYSVISLLASEVFQGIPGLNLELRKERYVRKDRIPTFIYERTPQKNREDLWELLEEVGMDTFNHLEWLIRTDKTYTGDHLIAEAYQKPRVHRSPAAAHCGDRFILKDIKSISTDNYALIKFLHDVTIQGATLEADDFTIDDDNRKTIFALIHPLYENEVMKRKATQKIGINKAKKAGKYTGRKKIHVSIPLLHEVIQRRDRGELTLEEAMNELGIQSKSTFYRRVREFKEKHSME
jgi:hypothetical protein